jgi:hypothetical protein
LTNEQVNCRLSHNFTKLPLALRERAGVRELPTGSVRASWRGILGGTEKWLLT